MLSMRLGGGIASVLFLCTVAPTQGSAAALTQFSVETVFSVYGVNEPGSPGVDFGRMSTLFPDLYDANPLAVGGGRALISPGRGFAERRGSLGSPLLQQLETSRLSDSDLPYHHESTLGEPFGTGSVDFGFRDTGSELKVLSRVDLHDSLSGDGLVSAIDTSISASVSGIDEVRYGAVLAWEIVLSPDSFLVGSLAENSFLFDAGGGDWAPIVFGFDNRGGFEGFIDTPVDIDPFGPLGFEYFFDHSTDAATGFTTVEAWAVSTNGTPINVAGSEARQGVTLSVLDDSAASFRLVDAPADALALASGTFGFRSAQRVPEPKVWALWLVGLLAMGAAGLPTPARRARWAAIRLD